MDEARAGSLSFAAKLERILAEVSNDCCRRELAPRSVELIRTHHVISKALKRRRIIEAIKSVAHAIDEIVEDCHFSKGETEVLLAELMTAGIIEKRERGGILNRGRRMKYHYFLLADN